MSLPRTLFWSGLALLAALWLSSVSMAWARGGWGLGATETESSVRSVEVVRDLAPFTRISNRGSVDLEVTVGGEQHVEVAASDDVVPKIETTVEDGELIVSTTGSFWSMHPTTVKITVPQLEALVLHGSGDASIDDATGSHLDLQTYGSGDITASGKVDHLSFTSFGSGDGSLADLEASDVIVRLRGSGDAHVDARNSLDAESFGSGDVNYQGSPSRVTKVVHGSGDVTED